MTLSIAKTVAEKAKIYAKLQGRSLSKLIEDYLRVVTSKKRMKTLKRNLRHRLQIAYMAFWHLTTHQIWITKKQLKKKLQENTANMAENTFTKLLKFSKREAKSTF